MEPYARQKKKVRIGGEKGKHMLPRLVLKVYEGKTSYELPRKVKVMIKKRVIYWSLSSYFLSCDHGLHCIVAAMNNNTNNISNIRTYNMYSYVIRPPCI